jgi:polar amino acid transport system permease protein
MNPILDHPTATGSAMVVVPVRRPGLWAASAFVVVTLALFAMSVWRNPNIVHSVIVEYQLAPAILHGLRTTVVLALLAASIGIVLGTLLAVMRLSDSAVLRVGSGIYAWLVRGTPLLVQILVWGNFALLFRTIGPFETNRLITPFVASVLALGLNEAAYMGEIVRAGIMAVDRGQTEAATALAMSRALALRRVVLPQALRVIIPPAGNQFISLLKATSLVSVIAGGDLLTSATNISSGNLRTIELLLVATFWYLALTSITSVGQYFVERRLARSTADADAGDR